MLDRARGLMVGLAAGNLLGIVQESWSKQQVAARFPEGVREIAAADGYPDDDDLAQAIIVAEAAERGPLAPDDLGRRLWHWAETNGFGIGNLTGQVLMLYGGDVPQCLASGGLSGDAREPSGMPILKASATPSSPSCVSTATRWATRCWRSSSVC